VIRTSTFTLKFNSHCICRQKQIIVTLTPPWNILCWPMSLKISCYLVVLFYLCKVSPSLNTLFTSSSAKENLRNTKPQSTWTKIRCWTWAHLLKCRLSLYHLTLTFPYINVKRWPTGLFHVGNNPTLIFVFFFFCGCNVMTILNQTPRFD